MAGELYPTGDFEAPTPERIEAVMAGEVGYVRRVVRDGIQTLAHGAFACPRCSLPLWPGERMAAGSEISCPFCDHRARARDCVVPDVYDTVSNEVFLIARIAPR